MNLTTNSLALLGIMVPAFTTIILTQLGNNRKLNRIESETSHQTHTMDTIRTDHNSTKIAIEVLKTRVTILEHDNDRR